MKRILLKSQKGFILILTYILIVTLVILSAVFLIRTTNESRLVRREADSRQALNMAEQGIAYAMAELKLKGWDNWFTHTWNMATDPPILVVNQDPETRIGFIGTKGPSDFAYRCEFGEVLAAHTQLGVGMPEWNNVYKAYAGSYFVPSLYNKNANRVCFVRIFPDLRGDISSETLRSEIQEEVLVIRSIGIVNGVSRAVEKRLSHGSLYDNFYFYPESHTFKEDSNFDGGLDSDGNPIGRIHINGNLGLQEPTFINMEALTCSGKIFQDNCQYISPIYYDRTMWDATNKSRGGAAVNGSGDYGRLGANEAYRPAPISDLEDHFYHGIGDNYASVNGVNIPFNPSTAPDDDTGKSYGDPFGITDNWPEWDWSPFSYNSDDKKAAAVSEFAGVTLRVPINVGLNDEIRDYEQFRAKSYLTDTNPDNDALAEDWWNTSTQKGPISSETNASLQQKKYWYAKNAGAGPGTLTAEWNQITYQDARPKNYVSQWWNDPYNYSYGTAAMDGYTIAGTSQDRTILVNYLNTDVQRAEWDTWSSEQGTIDSATNEETDIMLSDVLRDGYSGNTKYVIPPMPQESFKILAQNSGVVIGWDNTGESFINKAEELDDSITNLSLLEKPGVNNKPEDFVHPLYTCRTDVGVGSTPAPLSERYYKSVTDTNVLAIDLGTLTEKVKNNPALYPNAETEGIILYIDLNRIDTEEDGATLTTEAQTQNTANALHDYTVRLYNAQTLAVPITIVSPNQTVQLHGDFNTAEDSWQPAAVITYGRIETLSNAFGDPTHGTTPASYVDSNTTNDAQLDAVLPLFYNRDAWEGKEVIYSYPDNCQKDNEFLKEYVLPELLNEDGQNDWNVGQLKNKISEDDRNDFVNNPSLFTWDYVRTNIPLSGDQQYLVNLGQAQYYLKNKSRIMPVATETTYNLAMVTPYPPEGHILERWQCAQADVDSDYTGALPETENITTAGSGYHINENGLWVTVGSNYTNLTVQGSFIRLPVNQAIDRDNESYYLVSNNSWHSYNYALGDNLRTISCLWKSHAYGILPAFSAHYEVRYRDPNLVPPGGFSGASESSWMEITKQDFLRTEGIPVVPFSTTLPPQTYPGPSEEDPYEYDLPPTTTLPPETTAPPATTVAPPPTT